MVAGCFWHVTISLPTSGLDEPQNVRSLGVQGGFWPCLEYSGGGFLQPRGRGLPSTGKSLSSRGKCVSERGTSFTESHPARSESHPAGSDCSLLWVLESVLTRVDFLRL